MAGFGSCDVMASVGALGDAQREQASRDDARLAWVRGWAVVVEAQPDPEVVTDATAREAIAALGLPWKVRESVSGVELVLIPPGEFVRGAPKDDPDTLGISSPQRRVRVPYPFYVGRTEVTQAEWERVMESNPSRYVGPNRPVDRVSWDDIQPFLERADLRLLRESEWEYVCRAGSADPRPAGWEAITVFAQPTDEGPPPVASKPANPWGVHDMLGSVWEWTRSWYALYEAGEEPLDATADDRRVPLMQQRVTRGGSFANHREHVHPALRSAREPDRAGRAVGFRVSKEIPEDLWRVRRTPGED